ncbi:MAG: PIN domain-containing protein [Burkholderiales bacterium]
MILVDTGFLYALLDRDDAWHARAVAACDAIDEAWVTTWPVLTEAVYLLTRTLGTAQAQALMREVGDGEITVWNPPIEAVQRLPVLMKRYADPPMDLADASLVVLAEALGHGRILTTDERDFHAYRWKSRSPFENLLAGF